MESRKRKREIDYPRITYHASQRTFDRLFKEESLNEMKEVVRMKLGLPPNTSIVLEQIRDGKPIDLEDDDDFDAFYSIAHSTSFASVTVNIGTSEHQGLPSALVAPTARNTQFVQSAGTHRELSAQVDGDHSVEEQEDRRDMNHTGNTELDTRNPNVSFISASLIEEISRSSAPRKKKRKPTTEVTSNVDNPSSTTGNDASKEITFSSTSALSNEPLPDTEPSSYCVAQLSNLESIPAKVKAGKKNKNKEKVQDKEPPPLAPPEVEPALTTDIKLKKKKKRTLSDRTEKSFPEEMAGVISRTSETNHKATAAIHEPQSEKREKKKAKKEPLRAKSTSTAQPSAAPIEAPKTTQENCSDAGDTKVRTKKSAKNKSSTRDEAEPSNAVQAALSRVLAAKRASLNIRVVGRSGAKESPPVPVGSDRLQRKEYVESNSISQPSESLGGSDPSASVTVTEPSPGQSSAPSVSLAIPSSSVVVENDGGFRPIAQAANPQSDNCPDVFLHHALDEDDVGLPSIPPVPHDTSRYANMDLDAIVRGPNVSISAANIPFSESSEEEGDQDLEEDDDEAEQVRRHTRTSRLAESSQEEDDADNDSNANCHNDYDYPLRSASSPLLKVVPEQFSFQETNRSGESQDLDTSGDVAFGDAFAADSAILKLLDPTSTPPGPASSIVEDVPDPSSISSTSSAQELTIPVGAAVAPVLGETRPPLIPTQIIEESADSREGDMAIVDKDENSIPLGPVQTGKNTRRSKGAKHIDSSTPRPSQRKMEVKPNNVDSIARRTRTASRMHALSSLTPPSLPRVLGHQSRVIKCSQATATSNVTAITALESQEPQVSRGWTVLPVSSPVPEGESMLVDELRSSSPGSRIDEDARKAVTDGFENGHASVKDPLFLLTESQPCFPYSQWTGNESQWAGDTPADQHEQHDPIVSESDESEVGLRPPSNATSGDKYRRLSDIARQRTLFNPRARANLASENKTRDMYGMARQEEEESESETDSDSDSEAEKPSHIPKARRAGVIRNMD